MLPGSGKRVLVVFLVWLAVSLGGLWLGLSRDGCVENVACVQTVIGAAAVFMVITAVPFILLLHKKNSRHLHQLTSTIQQIAQGQQPTQPLLPPNPDLQPLTHAVGQLAQTIPNQIHQLSQREKQLAAVLNFLTDGVLIIDKSGVVQLMNPAAEKLLEIKSQRALKRPYAEVLRHHQLIELYRQCQQDPQEHTAAIEMGNALFIQAVITPFTLTDALPTGEQKRDSYLLILQDLTHIRRLETIRRDFISNISHELRTPLSSLRIIVETLQDGALDDPPAAVRFLERAENEVDTMTQMVEELLELSRIESGLVPLQLSPTAVSDLLLFSVERLQKQAQRSQVHIQLDIPAHLPPVLADADRIHQVISNLLHNAIKFTPANGTITLSAKAKANEVEISVADTGIGIPQKDLPRVFERFYKTDPARTRGQSGTGLGLAICRHIVQNHNGRIWVKSKEGKGSTFIFTLPIAH
jgi:two-component system phosphate regulon sensor histidine kinase PhoR